MAASAPGPDDVSSESELDASAVADALFNVVLRDDNIHTQLRRLIREAEYVNTIAAVNRQFRRSFARAKDIAAVSALPYLWAEGTLNRPTADKAPHADPASLPLRCLVHPTKGCTLSLPPQQGAAPVEGQDGAFGELLLQMSLPRCFGRSSDTLTLKGLFDQRHSRLWADDVRAAIAGSAESDLVPAFLHLGPADAETQLNLQLRDREINRSGGVPVRTHGLTAVVCFKPRKA